MFGIFLGKHFTNWPYLVCSRSWNKSGTKIHPWPRKRTPGITKGKSFKNRWQQQSIQHYLVITFTEEFEFLGFFVHKHTIQMTRLYTTDFDGFVAPSHDLTSSYVCNRGGHLTPLKDNVFRHLWLNKKLDKFHVTGHRLTYLSISVYINTFIIVAKKQLHSIWVWQGNNTVRWYRSLCLSKDFTNQWKGHSKQQQQCILRVLACRYRKPTLNLSLLHGSHPQSRKSLWDVFLPPQLSQPAVDGAWAHRKTKSKQLDKNS